MQSVYKHISHPTQTACIKNKIILFKLQLVFYDMIIISAKNYISDICNLGCSERGVRKENGGLLNAVIFKYSYIKFFNLL